MNEFPIFVVQMTKKHYSADWSSISLNSTFVSRVNMHPSGIFFGCGILDRCLAEWHVHPTDSYPPRTTELDIIAHVINVHRSYPLESVGFVMGKIEPNAKPFLDFDHFIGIT